MGIRSSRYPPRVMGSTKLFPSPDVSMVVTIQSRKLILVPRLYGWMSMNLLSSFFTRVSPPLVFFIR